MPLSADEIIPGRLWVGACVPPDLVPNLVEIGISHVFSLQTDEDLRSAGIPLRDLAEALDQHRIGFRRHPTPDFDRGALFRNLELCVEILDILMKPRSACVYVHCTAGINRAPTVVAAWLMSTRAMSAREATEYVESRRSCLPYRDVLQQYEVLLRPPG